MSTTTYSVAGDGRDFDGLALGDALAIAGGMIGCSAEMVRCLFDGRLARDGEATRGANPAGMAPTGSPVTVRANGPHELAEHR